MHSLYRAYYFKWRCLYNSRLGVHGQSERNGGRVCGYQARRGRKGRRQGGRRGGRTTRRGGGEREREREGERGHARKQDEERLGRTRRRRVRGETRECGCCRGGEGKVDAVMASSCRQLKAPVILNHANPFSVSMALAPSPHRG